MGEVTLVTKEKLERMFSERKHDLSLGLSRSKMQVIEIVGDGSVQRRERGVHHQVMVSSVGFFHTGRCYPHIDETEADGRRTRHVGSVCRVDEIDLRVGRRRMSTRSSGC